MHLIFSESVFDLCEIITKKSILDEILLIKGGIEAMLRFFCKIIFYRLVIQKNSFS
jgi:hypothetical protein